MNCPLCGADEGPFHRTSYGTLIPTFKCGRDHGGPVTVPCLKRQLAAAEEKLVQMTLHTAMCNSQRIAVTDQRDRAVDAVRVTIIRLNNGGWPTVGGERDIALEQYLKAVVAEADAAKKEKPYA